MFTHMCFICTDISKRISKNLENMLTSDSRVEGMEDSVGGKVFLHFSSFLMGYFQTMHWITITVFFKDFFVTVNNL